ncbi:MAG: ribokinase [Chloroflexia bacterium]|nr:ribokinase [Chloroflexia bacterium]
MMGHITRDLMSDGQYLLGGTAFYAALTAARMGCQVAVYTSTHPALDLSPLSHDPSIQVLSLPAAQDTVFCNRYRGGQRQQFLLSRARPLRPQKLPPAWSGVPLVLLGPVAQELSPAWVEHFPQAVVGACLQGWLRRWDTAGKVRACPWTDAPHWLPRLDCAFVSDQDLAANLDWIPSYRAHSPLLILTAGAAGAILYQGGESRAVAPFPRQEVDPTGAGDIFATAFLLRRTEGAAPLAAARFAAAAAALSVRGRGAAAVPQRQEVERLLQEDSDVVTAA